MSMLRTAVTTMNLIWDDKCQRLGCSKTSLVNVVNNSIRICKILTSQLYGL